MATIRVSTGTHAEFAQVAKSAGFNVSTLADKVLSKWLEEPVFYLPTAERKGKASRRRAPSAAARSGVPKSLAVRVVAGERRNAERGSRNAEATAVGAGGAVCTPCASGRGESPAAKLSAARAAVRAVAAKAVPVRYEKDPQATPFAEE